MAGVKGMSQPGNHRKSLDEHKLHGTLRSSHKKKQIAEENKVEITPDAYFSADNEFTEEELFAHLAAYLHSHGMTAAVDSIMITQWAQLMKALREVKVLLDTHGVTHKIGNKLAINVFQEISKDIRVILAEYHLTPNTRGRATPVEDKKDNPDDPVDKFLSTMQ